MIGSTLHDKLSSLRRYPQFKNLIFSASNVDNVNLEDQVPQLTVDKMDNNSNSSPK